MCLRAGKSTLGDGICLRDYDGGWKMSRESYSESYSKIQRSVLNLNGTHARAHKHINSFAGRLVIIASAGVSGQSHFGLFLLFYDEKFFV